MSLSPMTTATSVLGIKFNGGVMIAADTLGSYGSLARFRDCPRILRVNDQIAATASGDYADFQFLKSVIEQKMITEECLHDGFRLKPKSLYSWLTRVMYNRSACRGHEQQLVVTPLDGYQLVRSAVLVLIFHLVDVQYQVGTVTAEGVTIEGPIKITSDWEMAHMVK
ncbi:hypothetical protein HPB48_004743 [Haemaphysalis longicornis]|uniref:Proteasome subunit beta type-4 n=1 Tax=Haemaphysalis longicornis TaxID=44386 RepID=A0A9J6G318_HAELO|nr:hypothetical protein HPB48_004743 [Haemaphysalis longicornis]